MTEHVMHRMSFQEVTDAVMLERAYQKKRWNAATTDSGGYHEVGTYILFMEHYVQLARNAIATQSDPKGSYDAMDQIRKVIALGFAAAEEHGMPTRDYPAGAEVARIAAIRRAYPGPENCTVRRRRDEEPLLPKSCERCGLGPCPFYNDNYTVKDHSQRCT